MKSSTEIIKILKPVYPKINKSTISMVRNSKEYGVCFSRKALKLLNENNEIIKKPKQKKKRITIDLTDYEYDLLKVKLDSIEETKQEYIKNLISNDIFKE